MELTARDALPDWTIQAFMTPTPLTIAKTATLQQARSMMNAHRVRHLPVLEGGSLVGVVSIHDIELISGLKDVDPDEVEVEEAMSTDLLAFPPMADLAEVLPRMRDRKAGSALVTDGVRPLGIFTTIDALALLARLIGAR